MKYPRPQTLLQINAGEQALLRAKAAFRRSGWAWPTPAEVRAYRMDRASARLTAAIAESGLGISIEEALKGVQNFARAMESMADGHTIELRNKENGNGSRKSHHGTD